MPDMASGGPLHNTSATGRAFVTTHWSIVWSARDGDARASNAALEKLCRAYWPPLYAYIRREGYKPEDAQDLTQEFLSRLIHKEWLNRLEDQRGKFRSFLLTFLKNFLSDERDRMNAQKRGGGKALVPLDAFASEERDAIEPACGLTADQVYERRWAQAVTNEAYTKLRGEYIARNKTALFEQIKDVQPGEHGERSYKEIGATLGISEQAVKNAVLTFRRRYARLLRDEIAQTVIDPSEVNEELQHLMRLFSR